MTTDPAAEQEARAGQESLGDMEPRGDQEVVWPDGLGGQGAPGETAGAGAQPLVQGLDLVAPGLACGPVFHLKYAADVSRVPAGCVLAVDSLTPALTRCADRVAAVAARLGSRASHFASVARESGLPVVSGLMQGRAQLPEGLLVTVDAGAGTILAGCAEALLDGPRRRQTGERQRLAERFAALARQTCHLSLTDPEAPDFSPAGCASLHDLVRYCHEKAAAEMVGPLETDGPDTPGRGLGQARRLASDLPLALYLLDLGGGLESPIGGRAESQADIRGVIQPVAIASAPMQALWQGLACAGEVWHDRGFCCDWQEFDRLSAGIFRKDSRLLASYALVSADYLHLLVRFGYHFAVLDSLCGPRAEANYVHFRFKGGGGLPEQRRLRIGFLEAVLSASGFTLRVRGDMLDARLARADAAEVRRALVLLGRLLVRTQRMDLGLADMDQAAALARDFLAECGTAS